MISQGSDPGSSVNRWSVFENVEHDSFPKHRDVSCVFCFLALISLFLPYFTSDVPRKYNKIKEEEEEEEEGEGGGGGGGEEEEKVIWTAILSISQLMHSKSTEAAARGRWHSD